MAVNYSHSDFKRYGPDRAQQSADTIALVVNPVKSDTFAAFQGKIIAQDTLASGDWNYAPDGEDLQVTINGKSGIDPSGTAADTDDIAVAVFDSVGETVYLVQDATDRNITNETGDTLNIPALVFYIREVTPVV
jgi:hypothetical protein